MIGVVNDVVAALSGSIQAAVVWTGDKVVLALIPTGLRDDFCSLRKVKLMMDVVAFTFLFVLVLLFDIKNAQLFPITGCGGAHSSEPADPAQHHYHQYHHCH